MITLLAYAVVLIAAVLFRSGRKEPRKRTAAGQLRLELCSCLGFGGIVLTLLSLPLVEEHLTP